MFSSCSSSFVFLALRDCFSFCYAKQSLTYTRFLDAVLCFSSSTSMSLFYLVIVYSSWFSSFSLVSFSGVVFSLLFGFCGFSCGFLFSIIYILLSSSLFLIQLALSFCNSNGVAWLMLLTVGSCSFSYNVSYFAVFIALLLY